MPSRIEQERDRLIAWMERHQLPVGTRIDREMTADALMADFITPLLAELAVLRSQDRGAREMRERAVECARYRAERATLAIQGGCDGQSRNEAVRDTAQVLMVEISALPLSPVRTEDGRDGR